MTPRPPVVPNNMASSVGDNITRVQVVDSSGVVSTTTGGTVSQSTGQGKTLLFASISTASSGATSVVAAAGSGLKIKVVSYVIVASAATTVKFQSASTDLTGAMSLAANGGVSAVGQASSHLFETTTNVALNINLGSAQQVSGHVSYFTEA